MDSLNTGHLRTACSTCTLNELCWQHGLSPIDLEQLHSIVRHADGLPVGSHLFQVGDKFTAVYAVRSGCVKSYTTDASGEEQVHGFHLAGDLLGFDAIYPEQHRCNAAIVQTCSVCVLPYQELMNLATRLPSLNTALMHLMSREFSKNLLFPDGAPAEQRMAAFLLDLSRRQEAQERAPYELDLAMSRQEIASYLGFTVETASRLLTKMQKDKLVKVKRKLIYLMDIDALSKIARHATNAPIVKH